MDASASGAVELWPRLRRRAVELSALRDFEDAAHEHYAHQNALNILTLRDCWRLQGERPLPRSFARQLLRVSKHETLDTWLSELPRHARDAETGRSMAAEMEKLLEPHDEVAAPVTALTYAKTATRAFEEAWWNDIHTLAHGRYINKETADCVDDPATLSRLQHPQRDLDQLGDYLLQRQRSAITEAGMERRAECGELPFHWRPEFDFPDFGGWRRNRDGRDHERDLLVVIPGRNRRQAVVMGDHYDTAYMEDVYGYGTKDGSGARLAAAGADDNHSATATLLQAAPIFLRLAREGRLERDIWLLHLTGEEFPADCLGARHFCQALVEKTLRLRRADGSDLDLSGTQVVGALVMDMIGHNREHDPDGFQISPGRSAAVTAAGVSGAPGERGVERRRTGVEPAARTARPYTRPAQQRPRAHPGDRRAPAGFRRGAHAGRSAEFPLQHRLPDSLRHRRSGRAFHGGLRHQPARLPRHS